MSVRLLQTIRYRRSYGRSLALSAGLPLACALVMLILPAAEVSGNLWRIVQTMFPPSAAACFGLACASLVGVVVTLVAAAIGARQPVRGALHVAIVTTLLAPAPFAVPLWPALLAATGLLALPTPRRLTAANDNEARHPRNPFALAA